MYKILGYAKKSGTLDNGRAWENITFYVSIDSQKVGLNGVETDKLKAPVYFDTSKVAIGALYNAYFDKYGKLMELRLVKEG